MSRNSLCTTKKLPRSFYLSILGKSAYSHTPLIVTLFFKMFNMTITGVDRTMQFAERICPWRCRTLLHLPGAMLCCSQFGKLIFSGYHIFLWLNRSHFISLGHVISNKRLFFFQLYSMMKMCFYDLIYSFVPKLNVQTRLTFQENLHRDELMKRRNNWKLHELIQNLKCSLLTFFDLTIVGLWPTTYDQLTNW